MEHSETVNLLLSLMRAENQQLCPECGERMMLTDRLNENGTTFVWFRCSKDGCTGQWLQRIPRTSFELIAVNQVAGVL